jgi:hypothetical protein
MSNAVNTSLAESDAASVRVPSGDLLGSVAFVSAKESTAAVMAARALAGRKGHGGASCTYRAMRPRDIQALVAEAFEAGAREVVRSLPNAKIRDAEGQG